MKAITKTKQGFGNVELLEVTEKSLERNEVKIKVSYSGICGTDLHIYHDTFMNFPPVVLGHEFSGVVTKVGDKVKGILIGDHVTVLPSTASTCGSCLYCKTGEYMFCGNRKGLGYALNGSFTQYINVREDMVYKIPEHTSLKQAALSEPIACAVHAIEEMTQIHLGDRVLLTGPGPIGLLCLLLLVKKGVSVTVVGTSHDSYRLQLAKELGANKIIELKESNMEELNNLKGCFDIIVECSGSESAINMGIEKVKKKGKFIQVGISGRKLQLDYDQILFKEIQLFGSVGHNLKTWNRVMNLYQNKDINFESLITHEYPLIQWEEAFKMAESKQAGKILFYYE